MVDMPVVTAAGLEDHVADIDPFRGEHIQVAGTLKILRIGLVFLPLGKIPLPSNCWFMMSPHFSFGLLSGPLRLVEQSVEKV
jgi:hypothetical protein